MAASLNVPRSDSTVTIRIIDTTSYGKSPANLWFQPAVAGHESFSFPCYAFLITNNQTNEHVLFDLGIRKDWQTGYPPAIYGFVGDGPNTLLKVAVEKDIRDILDADPGNLNISASSISQCIWSHHHFDHRGDMSIFPPSTKLVIGPGLRMAYPIYPGNLESELQESDFLGREVCELSNEDFKLTIGDYPTFDLFEDGSFYLLSSPGHTVGHLCGLGRVTTKPNPSFVFLGGDCSHHCAQFRPSALSPLPESISLKSSTLTFSNDMLPSPPTRTYRTTTLCPGSLVSAALHHKKRGDKAFYEIPPAPISYNHAEACTSRDRTSVFDADPDVLVIIAHDVGVLDVLPFYPESLNDWREKGLKEKAKWEFLGDFGVGLAS